MTQRQLLGLRNLDKAIWLHHEWHRLRSVNQIAAPSDYALKSLKSSMVCVVRVSLSGAASDDELGSVSSP